MTDMLVELIQNFIDGSESTLNSIFNSMLNLVFFIELIPVCVTILDNMTKTIIVTTNDIIVIPFCFFK